MIGIISITLFATVTVFISVFTFSKKSTETNWLLSIGLTVLATLTIFLGLVVYVSVVVSNSPF